MVQILDTTLREGEQTPGVTFTVEEKVRIARMLDEFGVDIIEGGHPAVSPGVRAGLKAVAGEGLRAPILAHARARRADIDLALECGVEWVGIFLSVRGERLRGHFGSDLDRACAMVADAVSYARDHGLKVRYTPEDALRTDMDSLVRVARTALEAGADRISLADTVGAATPVLMETFVRQLIRRTGASVSVHCHNDLGMAVANSLAAVRAGASLVDVTVNGLGERAGITDLAQMTTALETFDWGSGRLKLEMLPELSRTVEELSGVRVPRNAPVVGADAFAHNAGLHVAAALRDPAHYELFPAERVGMGRRFVIDKMSGRDLIASILHDKGVECDDMVVEQVLGRIKECEKGEFSAVEVADMAQDIGLR